jgi:preprotein translocase subunit YajC
MVGLSDSVTVGILLLLIFGAAAFYLYSRMTQNEKRLSLLENLLLTLKISTEASLSGPDLVEAVSNPAPLESQDVDQVNEEDYADMLKGVPAAPAPMTEESAEEMLRSMEVGMEVGTVNGSKTEVTVNYESMTVKELQGLAKERGLPSMTRKKELIEALKRGGAPPPSPMPLEENFAGVEADTVEGFAVSLDA